MWFVVFGGEFVAFTVCYVSFNHLLEFTFGNPSGKLIRISLFGFVTIGRQIIYVVSHLIEKAQFYIKGLDE